MRDLASGSFSTLSAHYSAAKKKRTGSSPLFVKFPEDDMTTVLSLIDSIQVAIRGPDEIEISIGQVQTFINDAAQEARSSGWLLPLEDDESITFAANTYEYNVPASFAYVYMLRVEDDTTTPSTWNEIIEHHLWDIRIDGGVPKYFIHRGVGLPVPQKLKTVGQKRPTIYSALADTIDPGMEAFLLRRATAAALGFVSATGDLDPQRFSMWQQHRRDAELLLGRHPMEYRVRPSSKYVLGR